MLPWPVHCNFTVVSNHIDITSTTHQHCCNATDRFNVHHAVPLEIHSSEFPLHVLIWWELLEHRLPTSSIMRLKTFDQSMLSGAENLLFASQSARHEGRGTPGVIVMLLRATDKITRWKTASSSVAFVTWAGSVTALMWVPRTRFACKRQPREK